MVNTIRHKTSTFSNIKKAKYRSVGICTKKRRNEEIQKKRQHNHEQSQQKKESSNEKKNIDAKWRDEEEREINVGFFSLRYQSENVWIRFESAGKRRIPGEAFKYRKWKILWIYQFLFSIFSVNASDDCFSSGLSVAHCHHNQTPTLQGWCLSYLTEHIREARISFFSLSLFTSMII